MGSVTSTSITYQASAPVINRPNTVAVGTIVWLGSEVMFFAGLFAIYFTLRSTSPELWEAQADRLNFPFSLTNTIILVLSSFTCQFGVFAAERLQPYARGPWWKRCAPLRARASETGTRRAAIVPSRAAGRTESTVSPRATPRISASVAG